jgi:lysophospholipase L1-like esterase
MAKDGAPPRFVLLKRIAVTVATVMVVLVLFEIYLRRTFTHITADKLSKNGGFLEHSPNLLVDYSSRGRRLVPNAKVVIHHHYISGLTVPIRTNSLGFRHRELGGEKAPNETRILVLGDSITFQDYLPEERTWTRLTQEGLQRELPRRALEVINTGIMDVGAKEELDLLEERGLQLRPDMVALALYLNDSRPSWGFAAETRHRGWLRRRSLLVETIYEKFALDRWLKAQGEDRFTWISAQDSLNWRQSREDFLKLAALAKFDWGSAWDPRSERIILRELERLSALGAKQGFKAALIMLPVSFQVYADLPDDSPQSQTGRLAAGLGIPTLDLLPVLRAHRKAKLFYDQCHLNQEGSAIVAQAVSGFLKDALPRPITN